MILWPSWAGVGGCASTAGLSWLPLDRDSVTRTHQSLHAGCPREGAQPETRQLSSSKGIPEEGLGNELPSERPHSEEAICEGVLPAIPDLSSSPCADPTRPYRFQNWPRTCSVPQQPSL